MFNAEDYKKNIENFNKTFLDIMKPFSFNKDEKVSDSINKFDQANKIIIETIQKITELQTGYLTKCAQTFSSKDISKCSINPNETLEDMKANSEKMMEHISEITKIMADSHTKLINL